MTRRQINPQPVIDRESGYVYFNKHRYAFDIHTWRKDCTSIFGYVGNILWVRETFYAYGLWKDEFIEKRGKMGHTFIDFTEEDMDGEYKYEDDPPENVLTNRNIKKMGWYKRPSIFMPKEASRLFLEITDIKIEGIWDISYSDCMKEGIEIGTTIIGPHYHIGNEEKFRARSSRRVFIELWKSINGAESYDKSPWVFAIEFKRIQTSFDFTK